MDAIQKQQEILSLHNPAYTNENIPTFAKRLHELYDPILHVRNDADPEKLTVQSEFNVSGGDDGDFAIKMAITR